MSSEADLQIHSDLYGSSQFYFLFPPVAHGAGYALFRQPLITPLRVKTTKPEKSRFIIFTEWCK